ncbi:hypothetical protein EWM64_g3704 [Hericium alpestre]|uniref:Uncharacterized protein n=1 Tax=Hericium alpestre TaxID=135208 RepID=A0A4Z0A362_9AGAM|nr:hypothetical protein EWM64_g3704 [Hericium alpestre]
MSNDALHERLYRDTPQPTQPSVSVQDNIQDSMPVISEEYTLDSPTASSNTVMTALQIPSTMIDILPDASAPPTIRRRSSRVHQWIEEQQSRPGSISPEDTAAVELAAGLSRLALPGQSMTRFSESDTGDARTLSSYVLVEEEDEVHSPTTPRGQWDEEAEDVFQFLVYAYLFIWYHRYFRGPCDPAEGISNFWSYTFDVPPQGLFAVVMVAAQRRVSHARPPWF